MKKYFFSLMLVLLMTFVIGLTTLGCGDELEYEIPDENPITTETSELSYEAIIWPSGTTKHTFNINPGYNEFIVNSTAAGEWDFKTWHRFWADPWSCTNTPPDTVVFTYWKDRSNPNDSWHYWPGGGLVCYRTPTFTTRLRSGSRDIIYKLVYQQYGDTPLPITAIFTRR
jgi:hypothetical protein